jgi:hypothetical protein
LLRPRPRYVGGLTDRPGQIPIMECPALEVDIMDTTRKLTLPGLLIIALVTTGCGTMTGATVGAGAGAAVGAGTGYGAKKGALIGTGIGAAAGAIYDISK